MHEINDEQEKKHSEKRELLKLNKQVITNLNQDEMESLKGGMAVKSLTVSVSVSWTVSWTFTWSA